MKKTAIISVFLALALLLTAAAFAYAPGDIDNDGSVTPADARLALRLSVGLDVCDDEMFAAADANGRSLLPREMAWEELGWGPDKIERAKRLLADEEMAWMSEPMLKPLTGEGDDDVRADIDAAATPSGARTAPQVEPARHTDRPHLAAQ